MNESLNQSGEHETDRVFQVVQRYLQQIERGESPNRTELEDQHPELVATMAPYLDAIEILHAAAPQLRSRTNSNEGTSAPSISLAIGEPLGDFQLVREIGRGGMGVVYEAVQLSLNRKVAVKVLPFAAALDSRQLQRFRNEAQAAAALHHPNIVPIYGVGCERGVHFYVMQLIDGQNLASLITNLQNDSDMFPPTTMDFPQTSFSDHRRAKKEESKADTAHLFGAELTTERSNRREEYYRTIAEMIVQAADALDYAHSLGIVHRDVKPANIIVDDNRNIWVADFGLAQIQTDHILTRTGDMLGTLRYMSPEQAGGPSTQIDQRTDVYSLGVTLYELLTLRRLFTAENHRALFRQVLEEEPAPMRSIDRLIPKELDIIAQKALSKTPSERYASAAEIRDDLKRFLDDLPIKARSPSTLERVAKWGRRHRGIVVSSVAALLVTVAGLSVAMWMIASAYDRERTKAVEAEQNFRQARAAVDEFMKIADESLVGNPMMESVRIRMLESALVYYQTFIKQRRDDSFLHADLEASLAKAEAILNELKTLTGSGQYILLQNPAVREDLQLEEKVIARLEAFDHRWRTMGRDIGELNRTERDHRRLELATQQRAEIQQLLTTEQQARFQQLVWQEAGPRALEDAVLANKLDLSTEQRTEIRQLFAEYNNFPGKPFRFRPPIDAPDKFSRPPDHWGPTGERFFKESDEIIQSKLTKILTAEQSERWKQLMGKPLNEPLHS